MKKIQIFRKIGRGVAQRVKVEPIPELFALIDDCDDCIPARLTLCFGYPVFWDGSKQIRLHNWVAKRMGMVLQSGETVDHKNRVRLDSQRHNLRSATELLQQQNKGLRKDSSTGFRGVTKDRKGFRARLGYQGLGTFDTPEEASSAYESARAIRDKTP